MDAGEASITVQADAHRVYAVVSDITRTGEWSPECVRAEWIEGSNRAVSGARFRGHNKQGNREWSMEAVVDEAEPGVSFSFHTVRAGNPRTRWGYRLSPDPAGGTIVTEWYERLIRVPPVMRVAERLMMGGRKKHNDENMRASLTRLKAVVEQPA